MQRVTFIALLAWVLFSAPALSQDATGSGYKAMVEVTNHRISVNQGSGFQQVDGITPINPGDLVMASEGGHGWILYPDCDVEVLPGKVYTVENRPGVVQVRDAKEVRQICKRAAPWWLLAAPVAVGICAAADCFKENNERPRPTSP